MTNGGEAWRATTYGGLAKAGRFVPIWIGASTVSAAMPQNLPICEAHPDGRPLTTCPVCGKTVCSECVHHYGYFCSEACREAFKESSPEEDVPEESRLGEADVARIQRRVGLLVRVVPLALICLVLAYIVLRAADRSGEERWRLPAESNATISDLVYGAGTLFAVLDDGEFRALDPRSGNERWRARLEGDMYASQILVTGDRLLASGYQGVTALDTAGGETAWTHDLVIAGPEAWAVDGGLCLLAGSALHGAEDDLEEYDETELAGMMLSLVDVRTGEVRWERPYDPGQELQRVRLDNDLVLCLVHEAGESDWVPCAAHVDASWQEMGACDQCTYAETRAPLYQLDALDSAGGTRRWGVRLESDQVDWLFRFGDRISLVSAGAGYAFDLDGKEVWRTNLDAPPADVSASAGALYVATESGTLHCVEPDSGVDRWTKEMSGYVSRLAPDGRVVYAVVDGWKGEGETARKEINPLDALPDTPEAQMLKEVLGQDDEELGALPLVTGPSFVVALSAASGKVLWDRRLFGGVMHAHGGLCYVVDQPPGALLSGHDATILVALASSSTALANSI